MSWSGTLNGQPDDLIPQRPLLEAYITAATLHTCDFVIMEVHPGSWQSYDQAPMTSAPCDQGMLHCHEQQSRTSQSRPSTEEEWQQIIEELEAGNGHLTHDFAMLSPQHPEHSAFHHHGSARQSIEVCTAMDAGPQLSATSSNSSSFSYMQPEPQYEMWSATSVPSMSLPPAIPEHEPWSAPPTYNHLSLLPQHMAPTTMGAYEDHFCNHTPPPAHHLMAGPSPMLSQGSPHDPDFMDEDWSQQDVQQQWPDSSGSDELIDGDAADPCYAQLLYRCLKEAPEHMLSLRELYDWVKEHSQKAKDPKNRGWQNSVRHNLSMNAVSNSQPSLA